MGSLMIFLTIFILVVSTKTTKLVEPAKSELKRFADNFRILSRVTNAIHLQSVLAQKSFKMEDLLAELLEVKLERFDTLMNLPIDPAKSEVNRIHNVNQNSTKSKKKKISRETIREYIHVIDVLATLVKHEDYLNESSGLPADFIFKAAKKVESYSIVKGQCETLDEANLLDFQRLFPSDEDSFELPNDTEIQKILEDFKGNNQSLIGCLDSFEVMDNTSEASDVQAAYRTYGLVRLSFKILFDFAMHYKKIKTLGSFSKELIDEIENRSVWQRSKGLENVITQLNETFHSYVTQREHNEYYTRPKPKTAGFRSAENLPMLFKDLKHPWFKEVIARNKSTKELQSALEPYKNLYSKISVLGATWRKIVSREVDELTISDTKEAVGRIANITTFSEDSSRFLEILKNSSEVIQCLTNKNIDLKSFGTFRREHQPMEKILNRFLNMSGEANIIKNHISYPAYGDQSRNYVYKNLIKSIVEIIQNSDKENVLLRLNRIREEIDKQIGNIKSKVLDQKFDFLDGLGRLSKLVKLIRKLKKKAEKLKDSTVKIKDLLKKTEVFKVVDCVKKKNFDASSLQFSLYVLDGLLALPNNNTVSYINEFLDQLKKVQIDVFTVKKVFTKDLPTYPTESSYSKIFKPAGRLGTITKQLGENLKFIEDLEEIRLGAKLLPNVTKFPDDIEIMIKKRKLKHWVTPFESMRKLLSGIRRVREAARNVNNSDVESIEKVFDKAADVQGIEGPRKFLNRLYHDLQISHLRDKAEALQYFKVIHKLDLDFTAHQSRLKNSRSIIEDIKKQFDEIFGNLAEQHSDVQYIKEVSWIAILGSCVGLVLLLLIGALLFYGMTASGRAKYADLWMYYFGSTEDFEKRWRYCRFLDYSNGRNHLLEAVREVNTTNLLKAVKSGVYINAYNRHGNTALHVATKLGHPEIVKILIKNGADRALLNGQNRTPEQMIITKSTESLTDKPAEIKKIQKIYNKYRKKKFRLKVPPKFPESSFHIWIDEEVNVDLYNKFVGRFQSISSDEVSTATHCVVKTDENGVLHTDNLDLLSCIFHGIIIVRDTWLTDSLADETLIMEDSKYLVESVMYKGTKFDTVLKWSEAMAKGTMPFLYGVHVAAVMTEYDNLYALSSIVDSQGGTVMEQFPLKKFFNKNTHPYLHAHLGPIFLIHDGSINLKLYKNDPDKMYTLFTEQEFISFLLKREINRDTRENLVTVWKTPKK